MNARMEGTIAIVLALFVLLSAMWDARISAGVAIVALAGFGIYRLVHKSQ